MKLMKKAFLLLLAASMPFMTTVGYAHTTYANIYNSQGYILPSSSSTYLTKADIQYLTAYECKLARNEIYARHGRMFNDANLQAYFNSKTWYVPRIAPANFSDNVLNAYENANVVLLLNYEKAGGYTGGYVAPTQPVQQPVKNNYYILNGSNSRYISRSELQGLSAYQCKLARNEIYARHGRLFKDANLQAYFNSQAWYYGYISPDNFNDNVLNVYEEANVQTILNYCKAMGYN